MVRLTYQRQHKYVGTGVFVPAAQFNPEGTYDKRNWVRKTHQQHPTLNGILKAWLDRAEGLNKLFLTSPSPLPWRKPNADWRIRSVTSRCWPLSGW